MKDIEHTITLITNALKNPSSLRLDQINEETLNQIQDLLGKLIQPKEDKHETEESKKPFSFHP